MHLGWRYGPAVQRPLEIVADRDNGVCVLENLSNQRSPAGIAGEQEDIAATHHHDAGHAESPGKGQGGVTVGMRPIADDHIRGKPLEDVVDRAADRPSEERAVVRSQGARRVEIHRVSNSDAVDLSRAVPSPPLPAGTQGAWPRHGCDDPDFMRRPEGADHFEIECAPLWLKR